MRRMQWDTGRQIQYGLGLIVALAIIGVGGYFGFFYHVPSCTDGVINGKEEGVDCGGACQRLCTGPLVSVVWARSVKVAPGAYHAVALVKNPDTAAKGVVPYKVSLFDSGNILVATREGTINLGPGDVAPLFEPNIDTGNRVPARTFIDIGRGAWERGTRMTSPVRIVPTSSADDANTNLSLSATIQNTGSTIVPQVTVTALLYDASSTLVAASQTTVESLAAREGRAITFTWQSPFTSPAVTFDLIPRVQ
jgi:hypothetical protein